MLLERCSRGCSREQPVAPGVAPSPEGFEPMARGRSASEASDADGSLHVHGKAANGEGSLYRDSDGSWRATYFVVGETRPRRVRGRTREEAMARRAAKLDELAASQSAVFHIHTTVAELAHWWLETVARHRVRPSSFTKYTDRVARIGATLGDVEVRALKPERVARWQADLLSTGLGPKTVADAG